MEVRGTVTVNGENQYKAMLCCYVLTKEWMNRKLSFLSLQTNSSCSLLFILSPVFQLIVPASFSPAPPLTQWLVKWIQAEVVSIGYKIKLSHYLMLTWSCSRLFKRIIVSDDPVLMIKQESDKFSHIKMRSCTIIIRIIHLNPRLPDQFSDLHDFS